MNLITSHHWWVGLQGLHMHRLFKASDKNKLSVARVIPVALSTVAEEDVTEAWLHVFRGHALVIFHRTWLPPGTYSCLMSVLMIHDEGQGLVAWANTVACGKSSHG